MDFPKNDAPDRIDCELCDVKSIHKNDFEKHLQSRKHRGLMKKSTKTKELTKFMCEICVKTLTSEEFLRRHLESKSHKSKASKHGFIEGSAAVGADHFRTSQKFKVLSLPAEPSESVAASIHSDKQDLDDGAFYRKKYKPRSDFVAFEYLESYIYSAVSQLSLRLALDPNATEFYISVNDKRWHTYGDIAINMVYKEKPMTYAIRCKHISDTPQSIDSLKDAKIYLEKEYDSIICSKKHKDYMTTKFAIFTTCNISSKFLNTAELSHDFVDKKRHLKEVTVSNKVQVKSLGKRNDVINISSENDNIFSIFPDSEELELPPLYLYTNQRILPHITDEIIKKNFKVTTNFSKEYADYIENWAQGKLGGYYFLTKKDILLKIGEILLSPYVFHPKMINLKGGNFETWNKIVKETDVIVIQNEPFVLGKICEPFNQTIENSLTVEEGEVVSKVKIDSITKTVNITDKHIEKIKDYKIKAYLLEHCCIGKSSEVRLTKLYNVFWKTGHIPLPISLESNKDSKKFIFDLISFLKKEGLHKKFLLKSDEPFFPKITPPNLKVFSCLDDIKDIVNLEDIKIRISNISTLSLNKISESDPFFLRWVTPGIFFDMVLDKYTMRKDETSQINIPADFKIILDNKTKEHIRSTLYPGEEIPIVLGGRLIGVEPGVF